MTPLDESVIFRSRDKPLLVGARGEVLATVTSTMDVARQRALDDVPDGYVVVAEYQTAGRGRDRAWECPAGMGLLASFVLRLSIPAGRQKLIIAMGAVAAAEAVRRFGVPALIKWPNDVVVAAPGRGSLRVRKLGGLLVERVARGDAAPAHVLGIGLNVNQRKSHLPASAALEPTSMWLEARKHFDRNAVCRALLEELSRWYRRLALGQDEHILARWRRLSCLLRQAVRARVEGQVIAGKVVGIRATGELIFEGADGGRRLLSDEKTDLLL